MHKLFSLLLLLAIISCIFGTSPVFAEVPNAPTGLSASAESTATTIRLQWTAPSSGGTPTGYTIEGALEVPNNIGTFSSFTTVVDDTDNVTSYVLTGLTQGNFYQFRVAAFNTDGFSPPSSVFNIGTQFADDQNYSSQTQNFSDNVKFGEGTQFAEGQNFSGQQDFSSGKQNFAANTQFADGQDFLAGEVTSGDLGLGAVGSTEADFYDIFGAFDVTSSNVTAVGDGIIYISGIIFADFSAVLSGSTENDVVFTDANSNGIIDCVSDVACELADLGTGVTFANTATIEFIQEVVQDFTGSQTFGEDAKFADNQSFSAVQSFSGANTFGAGTTFDSVQNFADITVGSGNLGLAERTTGTANIYDILQSFDTPTTTISALGAGNSYSTGIVYVDFSAVLSGNAINDIQFTDNNSNGIIDCVSDGACELADLSTPVTFANSATMLFDQSTTQTFGAGTDFTVGTSFGNEQAFTSTMDFTDGAMIFAPGMDFFAGQVFTGFDHNFAFDDMTYGSGATFNKAQTFGMDADFAAGTMTFLGANTFGKDTTFANNQSFCNISECSGVLNLGAVGSAEADFYDIFAAFDDDNNGTANTSHTDSVSATNSGSYSSGIIYADFSAVLSGNPINNIVFTDANSNGIIDCVSDGACELADLSTGVTFANTATITFTQDYVQTFGSDTEFSVGTTFGNEQAFASTMDFTDGALTFAAGMDFFAGQNFTGFDHNFAFDDMTFGSAATFNAAQTFGIDADFDAGTMTFDGANTFGKDTKFADNQNFSNIGITTSALDLGGVSNTEVEFVDIFAAFDNTSTSVSATNS
ncbi:fibronectin type III domain-containing protein, partial [Marine Group I thaumarchaeote]|nr:fibronectin type III domain-containing protein [Marine Group I thaumarchaeote]